MAPATSRFSDRIRPPDIQVSLVFFVCFFLLFFFERSLRVGLFLSRNPVTLGSPVSQIVAPAFLTTKRTIGISFPGAETLA